MKGGLIMKENYQDFNVEDFQLDEVFDDDVFMELNGGYSNQWASTSPTFNSYTANWGSVGAAMSALVSKGPGKPSNTYTELKCC